MIDETVETELSLIDLRGKLDLHELNSLLDRIHSRIMKLLFSSDLKTAP